jgi:D-tyrosyl-tRNA(Tyr) deacylase
MASLTIAARVLEELRRSGRWMMTMSRADSAFARDRRSTRCAGDWTDQAICAGSPDRKAN